MSGDEQLTGMFEGLRFTDEPPMTSMAADDARRGQRRLRRRRVATLTSGVAGIAVVATGVAIALPVGGSAPGQEIGVAGSGGSPTAEATPGPATSAPSEPDLAFPGTRQLLLDTAAVHFDPERTHLPDESTGFTGGGTLGYANVGTKLEWTVPGEAGLGMVQVAVTSPGYASAEEYARDGFAADFGCAEPGSATCAAVNFHGASAFVADSLPAMNLEFGVVFERSDGSMVGVGVYDLFGNNSRVPVSEVGITVEQALSFVVDVQLQVDPDEAAEFAEQWPDESATQPPEEQGDFSSTETAPAPAYEELSQAEAQEVVDECTEGTDGAWDGYTAVFGLRADVEAGARGVTGWVIAEKGDTRLLCQLDSSGRSVGGSLFGTPEVKDSPYLFAPVEAKQAGFGLYVSDVAQVTVQASGGPEQDAIMRDGYWFLPDDGNGEAFALRGYGAAGGLIYDSTTDDPESQGCFTDPDGLEVIREGDVANPAPETCERALEWGY